MTKAYSVNRPVSIGTYPTGYAIDGVVNYDARIWVEEIHRYAWGHIIYAEVVPEDVLERYDMMSAEHSVCLVKCARAVAAAYQMAEQSNWDEELTDEFDKLYDKGEERFGFDAWDRAFNRECEALGCTR